MATLGHLTKSRQVLIVTLKTAEPIRGASGLLAGPGETQMAGITPRARTTRHLQEARA
jgi:hypothetical protein